MIRRRVSVLLASAALVSVAAVSPAPAVDTAFVAVPGSYLTSGYGSPVAVANAGGTILFGNLDIQAHDFVADGVYRPDGSASWCDDSNIGKCPLFWTRLILAGQTVNVQGLEDTDSGNTYPFFCTRHPGMVGTLLVV